MKNIIKGLAVRCVGDICLLKWKAAVISNPFLCVGLLVKRNCLKNLSSSNLVLWIY